MAGSVSRISRMRHETRLGRREGKRARLGTWRYVTLCSSYRRYVFETIWKKMLQKLFTSVLLMAKIARNKRNLVGIQNLYFGLNVETFQISNFQARLVDTQTKTPPWHLPTGFPRNESLNLIGRFPNSNGIRTIFARRRIDLLFGRKCTWSTYRDDEYYVI